MLHAVQNDFKAMVKTWPRICSSLSIIRTPRQYKRALTFLDFLVDTVGNKKSHSLAELRDLVSVLIEDYESKHVKEPIGDPISSLRLLMEEHKLTSRDLPELGSFRTVSQILHRKKKLNLAQIKALSKRFHVSPSIFIEDK